MKQTVVDWNPLPRKDVNTTVTLSGTF